MEEGDKGKNTPFYGEVLFYFSFDLFDETRNTKKRDFSK